MTIEKCKRCGKEFAYEHTGNSYPGGKEREAANCPYCGEEAYSIMTSGFVYSYKLDKDGNVDYKERF